MSTTLKAMSKYLTPGAVLQAGFAGWQATDTYKEKRQDGHSKLTSAILGAGDAALWGFFPGQMMALEAVSSIPTAAYEFGKWQSSYRRQLGREQRQVAFQNVAFQDTQATYTMRQAGLAIAARSRDNTQAAMLGHEAAYMKK